MCCFQGETGSLRFPTFLESTWTNLWKYLQPALNLSSLKKQAHYRCRCLQSRGLKNSEAKAKRTAVIFFISANMQLRKVIVYMGIFFSCSSWFNGNKSFILRSIYNLICLIVCSCVLTQRGSVASCSYDQRLHAAAQHPPAGGGGRHGAEPVSPLPAPQQRHAHENPEASGSLHLVCQETAGNSPT